MVFFILLVPLLIGCTKSVTRYKDVPYTTYENTPKVVYVQDASGKLIPQVVTESNLVTKHKTVSYETTEPDNDMIVGFLLVFLLVCMAGL